MTRVHSTIIEDRPADVTVRAHRAMLTEANAFAGKHWHRVMLPRHFEPSARHTYKYQPRTSRTIKRKKNIAQFKPGKIKKGGLVDNVWTGAMEQAAKTQVQLDAYPSRCTVTMGWTLRYMGMKPWKSGHPDKNAEITAVTQSEGQVLERIWGERYEKNLAQYRERRVTKL